MSNKPQSVDCDTSQYNFNGCGEKFDENKVNED